MRFKIQLILFLCCFTTWVVAAQQLVGLWEITEVNVGTEIMTPQAKWTQINADGTFRSGNGWLQNAQGTWNFDKKSRLFSLKETNGIIDSYGPFTVEFTKDGMGWLREEEGMIVRVALKKIEQLPKGPADDIVGLWGLQTAETSSEELLFIRWDRIYINRSKKGKATGYWHVHGHKPELTFLPHSKKEQPATWRIEATEKNLKLIGISDSNKNQELTYLRRYKFSN